MKKVLLLLLASVALLRAEEKTDRLEFTEVIQVDGVTSSNLYLRAKVWFADSFLDSNRVLEVEDKEAGLLAGKGTLRYIPNVFISSEPLKGYIRFSVKVMVKDGKYKYVFSDFFHTGTPTLQSKGINFGEITKAKEPPKIAGATKGWSVKVWAHLQKTVEEDAKGIIEDLKKKMVETKTEDF